MVTFNPVNAENSQYYAHKCWYNYNYEKNTMGISEEDIQKINEQYQGKISEWKAAAEKDNNSYVIDDNNFTTANLTKIENNNVSKSYAKGRADAAEKTGVSGDTTAQTAQTAANFAMSGVAVFVAAAPIALAVGALYMATQPNKDEARALTQLKEDMAAYESEIETSQDTLIEMLKDNVDLAAIAEKTSEKFEKTMEAKQVEYEQAMEAYQAILERVNSGEPIDETDKELLKVCGKNLQTLGAEIAQYQEDSVVNINDAYDAISSTEEDYNSISDRVDYMQGTVDFAASFDEATKSLATAEAVAQGINAGMGYFAGGALAIAGATPFSFWLLAFSAMALTGAGLSTSAVVQQTHVIHDVDRELDVRKNIEPKLSEISDNYEDSYDGFETSLESVEDIEFEVPDEFMGLEDFEIPDINDSNSQGDSASTNPFAAGVTTLPTDENTSEGTPNNPFAQPQSESEDKKNPFA